ncbi:hypothetical protein FOA52_000945 [Chlamydomonas sp. UWO 241]|nr:hypothetical protein FOA52_000945 [Chlamydomonas sp. UWO 241]
MATTFHIPTAELLNRPSYTLADTEGLSEEGAIDPQRSIKNALEDVVGVTRGTIFRQRHAIMTPDEMMLFEITEQEATGKQKKVHMAKREDLIALDKRMAADADFGERMFRLVEKYDVSLPTITVAFKDVHLTTSALMGSKAVPTVGRSFVGLVRSLVCMPEQTTPFTIVDNASGVLVPGRMTLLLGPPSSGKTSLLKYLCGRMKGSSTVGASGSVTYNGHTFDEFDVVRTTANCGQVDEHIPQCTVLETLEFAHTCQHGRHADIEEMADLILKAVQERGVTSESVTERASAIGCKFGDVTTDADGQNIKDEVELLNLLRDLKGTRGLRILWMCRMLGIQHTLDTPVGDAMLRGVSGGERKRVTIAEMIVGGRRALFLDEISTGLDSATLFSVIRSVKSVTHGFKYTTMISLLQPPPEVFWEFDDLMLMADGKIAWHGPVGDVIDFFSGLGFLCPVRKDVPSFLQEVVTYTGQLDYASDALLAERGFAERAFPGDGRKQYVVPIDDIRAAFWAHPAGQAQKKLIDTPFDMSQSHPAALRHGKYALNAVETLAVVVRRQWLLMFKDFGLMKGRVIQSLVVGLLVGGLFYQVPKTETNGVTYFGAIFLMIMFTSMGAMVGLTTALQTKGVWLKHRDNQFYPAWAHAAALTITQLPYQCVDVLVWIILTYFMVGFTYDAGRFFTSFIVLVGVSCSFGTLFRAIGHSSADVVAANSFGGLMLLILIVMSGFTIPSGLIPPWWIWAFWMSPYSWAMRALAINEMTSNDWTETSALDPSQTVGQYALVSFNFQFEMFWIWAGVGYLFGIAFVCTMCSALALKYLGGPAKIAAIPDEEELAKARKDAEVRRAALAAAFEAEAAGRGPAVPASAAPKGSVCKASAAVLAVPAAIGSATSAAGKATMAKMQDGASQSAEEMRGAGATPAAAIGEVVIEMSPADSIMAVQATPAKAKAKASPGGDIPFEPITLVWQNLQYFVPNPSVGKTPDAPAELELLKSITGWAKPGELTALMGGSGAGKTTLMDCVAGRKTSGLIKGDITVNGHPKIQATWSRVMGYVEQMDIHTAAQTVIEALLFSARLRLPSSVSEDAMRNYVDQVVDLVDLTEIVFNLVGMPGVTGLSVEQRKRLTIANEMVANPSVIFMDEPTSGLDARAASIVMRAVRNVGNSNRAVVVTIHQPSIEIFETFDNLLLLQRGGRTTYFGPLGFESNKLVGYLQAVPGCEPMKDGLNPATWMLEITGGAISVSAKKVDADWPQLYADGALGTGNADHAAELVANLVGKLPPISVTGHGQGGAYAATFNSQVKALSYKFVAAYWRMPNYNYVRYVTAILVAVIYGSIYYKTGQLENPTNTGTVQSIGGVVYLSASFMGMSSMMAVMPLVGGERIVYYREQASSSYNPWAYGLVMSLVEVPYQIVQVVVFICIMYPMVSFVMTAESFFFYMFMNLLSLMMYVSMGMALMYLSPSQQLAQVSAAGLNFIFNIFNGYVLPYPKMAKGFQWVNRIVPTTWVIYGMVADQLAGRTDVVVETPSGETTVSVFMEAVFGYLYSFKNWTLLIVLAYILAFRFISVLALRYINFLKR